MACCCIGDQLDVNPVAVCTGADAMIPCTSPDRPVVRLWVIAYVMAQKSPALAAPCWVPNAVPGMKVCTAVLVHCTNRWSIRTWRQGVNN
jgi:hypothetical protein